MNEFLDSIDRLIALEEQLHEEPPCHREMRAVVIEASRLALLEGEQIKHNCLTDEMRMRYEEAADAYITSLNNFSCEELLFKAKRVLSFEQFQQKKSLLTS